MVGIPASRIEPRLNDRRLVTTAAPSPHRSRGLRRIGRDGRAEFLTQDGWVPDRIQPAVLPEESV